jgi:anti-sigma regulatory factor (Ser/Thr protein kinase)
MNPFHTSISPDLTLLRPLRSSLVAWLESSGVDDPPRADVVLATHEAAANAIEHSGSTAPIEIRARIGDGEVTVEIADGGRWLVSPPGTEERGRGLGMMTALVSRVEIAKETFGTTVRLVEPACSTGAGAVRPVEAQKDPDLGQAVTAASIGSGTAAGREIAS